MKLAGILCRSKPFWKFLEWHGEEFSLEDYNPIKNEEDAAAALKHFTSVDSRTEYKSSANARERFRKFHAEYEKFIERTSEL